MFSKSFVKETAERAVKSVVQALIVVLTLSGPLDVFSVDWKGVLGVALSTGLVSVLTSIASSKVGPDSNSPSVV